MLTTLVVLLAAATIAVPLTAGRLRQRPRLSARRHRDRPGGAAPDHRCRCRSPRSPSLGVVMLLFLIGLELRPHRLWVMRRAVFGLGSAQVVVTGAVLAVLAHGPASAWPGAIVLGAGLALSSTAIVLPMLARARPAGHAAPAATPSPCCCSRISPSFRWSRWCRCWPATAMPDHVPWHDVARAVGRDRRHPDRRPLPAAAAVPRDRRREDAGGVHRRRAADRRRHRAARHRRPACRHRSARSWPACCCRTPNTATSCRPISSRSRACCSASSSSRSACPPICRWRARIRRCSPWPPRHCCSPRRRSLSCWRASPGRTRRTRCASASPCRKPANSASCCSPPLSRLAR